MRKARKWIFLAVLVAVVVYEAKLPSVMAMTQPASHGKIVAEFLGTGALEAHYQAKVSSKIQRLLSSYRQIKMTGSRPAHC
ncbi:MAG: hypothetical protein M1511_07270 [Deltaproteobacteria bacterium]|nr:hypothetical protein [Deltaproteobacteria bacterium]